MAVSAGIYRLVLNVQMQLLIFKMQEDKLFMMQTDQENKTSAFKILQKLSTKSGNPRHKSVKYEIVNSSS